MKLLYVVSTALLLASASDSSAQDTSGDGATDAAFPCLGCQKRVLSVLEKQNKLLEKIANNQASAAESAKKSAISIELRQPTDSEFMANRRNQQLGQALFASNGNASWSKDEIAAAAGSFCTSMNYKHGRVMKVVSRRNSSGFGAGHFHYIQHIVCYD